MLAEQDKMDDDEYQRMVDYENEIYDLNHGVDQQSDRRLFSR